MECSLINVTQQMPLLCQRNPVPWTHPQHHRHQTTAIKNMHQPKTAKPVCTFLGLVRYYSKFIKDFTKNGQTTNLINPSQGKVRVDTITHTAFTTLKEAIIQATIICYLDPARRYIVFMDALGEACGAQLSHEHNKAEFPIAFLSHTFTETQKKWSTL